MMTIAGCASRKKIRNALVSAGMMIALAYLTGCSGGLGQAVLTKEQVHRNVESYDMIAKTISEKHWDQSLVGDSWKEACRELRPKVENARTAKQARAVMLELIATLGQTHFNVIPSNAYEKSSGKDHKGGEGSPQLDVRMIDGEMVVVSVMPDSPAANDGVRPGWIIERIDGDNVDAKSMPDRGHSDAPNHETLLMMRRVRFTMNKLAGEVGGTVDVVFRDGDNRKIKKALGLTKKRGHRIKFGHLPAMHTWIESRMIDGDVSYVRFNHFFDPMKVMPAFSEAVASSFDAKGMIIDLRGNGGGIGAMSMGMAGWFVEEENIKLGTMITKDSSIKFVINPRPRIFNGPLAILVDGLSASTSEILAGGLQDLGRARIFGTRTMGAALPSVFEKLPNGDGFQYAIANYISEGGQALEGDGVTPDTEVSLTRETLIDGHDIVMDAAVAWIHAESSSTK